MLRGIEDGNFIPSDAFYTDLAARGEMIIHPPVGEIEVDGIHAHIIGDPTPTAFIILPGEY